MITGAILEQLIHGIVETIWKRPEFERLRELLRKTALVTLTT